MKNFKYVLLAIFFSVSAYAEVVEVGNTGVTFVPPEGFTKVPQEIIDVKWPNKNAPRFVVGNERATTTVAYDIKPHDLSEANLEEVRISFEKVFNRVIPGIKWQRNEIIEKSGQDWIYMEMTSSAVDTDIYNIMLITDHNKEMLVFNFNSTKEDFSKHEKSLRMSIESIKLPSK